MAGKKSKKKQDQALQRSRLTRDKYFDFTATVSALRSDLDEASTEHAGAFKRGDSIGVHLEVSKLCMKLDKMEPTKRADFLRAFDLYREWYEEWTVQGDLLDTTADQQDSVPQGYNAGADEEDEADAAEAAAAPLPEAGEVNAPEPVVGTVEADFGDDKPLTPPAELEGAGYTFETGVAAGKAGEPLESNPHLVTHPAHMIWARGHAKGVKDAAAAAANPADAEAPGVEQDAAAIKGRRKPRVSAETASETVLH